MSLLNPIDSKLLFTKNDPSDVRLGDLAKLPPAFKTTAELQATLEEVEPNSFTLTGYPDDEGILKNGGRIGAADAPDRIRNFFYRMTPPALLGSKSTSEIYDLGNLSRHGLDLAKRHENARAIALQAHTGGQRAITFGGGHDYGFPDAAAYCEWARSRGEKPLVINFDAHLDVRPMNHGITSGTPFFRLLEEFPETDFVEIGLQAQCNSAAHVEWLKSKGGLLSFEEERHTRGESLTETLARLLGDKALKSRSAFLSIDIDAFTSAVAPGASQSWPTGFDPADFFSCFTWCMGRFDTRGLGVYEVSPRLDVDDRTSRLAALIAYRFVFQL